MEKSKSKINRQDLTDEQYQSVSHLFTVIRNVKASLAFRAAA